MDTQANDRVTTRFSSLMTELQHWGLQRDKLLDNPVLPDLNSGAAIAHFAVFGPPVFSASALEVVRAGVSRRIRQFFDVSTEGEPVEAELSVDMLTDVFVELDGEIAGLLNTVVSGTVVVSGCESETLALLKRFSESVTQEVAQELNNSQRIVIHGKNLFVGPETLQ